MRTGSTQGPAVNPYKCSSANLWGYSGTNRPENASSFSFPSLLNKYVHGGRMKVIRNRMYRKGRTSERYETEKGMGR